MKTAITIPDSVFAEAEKLARRMKKSRSEVYCLALAEFIARHNPEIVTEAMDKVCAELGNDDPYFRAVAAKSILERSEW